MPVGRPRADRQLPACREEGLTCRECVGQCAQELAQIADGLPAARIRQMFNAIYPQPNCMPMAGLFAQIVLEKQGYHTADRRTTVRAATVVAFKSAVA
jgi:hypothetical protein